MDQLERLIERTFAVVRGCAEATATTVEAAVVQRAMPYLMHEGLAVMAWDVMDVPHGSKRMITGSSDLGDVSQALPTVTVSTVGWDPVTWHSRELHDAAGTARAYASMHKAADHMVDIVARLLDRLAGGDDSWR